MKIQAALLILCSFLLANTPARAGTPGQWSNKIENSQRSLTYTSKVDLLGKPTTVSVKFRCDPTWDSQSSGTLGFEVAIKNPSKIAGFPFDEFEGPDAVASPEVRVSLDREGGPALTFKTQASGSYTESDVFTFDVSEVSKKSKSVPRSILKALESSGAKTLTISISTPGKPKSALEVTIPVQGKEESFRSLLEGLK